MMKFFLTSPSLPMASRPKNHINQITRPLSQAVKNGGWGTSRKSRVGERSQSFGAMRSWKKMNTKVGILNLDSIFSVFSGLYETIKYGVFVQRFYAFLCFGAMAVLVGHCLDFFISLMKQLSRWMLNKPLPITQSLQVHKKIGDGFSLFICVLYVGKWFHLTNLEYSNGLKPCTQDNMFGQKRSPWFFAVFRLFCVTPWNVT